MPLGPTEVVIFGNPQAGTPLMQLSQRIGIDLPLKMLVWQDATGETWLAYDYPTWLATRHGIDSKGLQVAGIMNTKLAAIARRVTKHL